MISLDWLVPFGTVPIPRANDALFQNRYETKYLFPAALLPAVLERLAADYDLALYGTLALQEYESLYFDDARLTFYQDHQRGKLSRAKVRRRYYPSSGFLCLEVKVKTNRNTARKWRRPVPAGPIAAPALSAADRRFVAEHLPGPAGGLEPSLLVRYERLTLRSRRSEERVTFDAGLLLSGPSGGRETRPLGDAVVGEVKQTRATEVSPFRQLMRGERISPVRFSKYCYGIHLTRPDARHNLFKPRHAEIARRAALWDAPV